VFPDGRYFDYVGDDERLFAQIAKFNPADVEGYKKLVDHSERIFDVGYTQLVDADFSRFGDMMRIVPDLVRLRAYKRHLPADSLAGAQMGNPFRDGRHNLHRARTDASVG
jgi:phytoene dehydrogenase-like protein